MGLNKLILELKKTIEVINECDFQLQTPKKQIKAMGNESRMSQNGEKSNFASPKRLRTGLQANFRGSIALQPVELKA